MKPISLFFHISLLITSQIHLLAISDSEGKSADMFQAGSSLYHYGPIQYIRNGKG
jgi:hypothetical protein